MADLSHFQFYSKYPLDMIVLFKRYKTTIPAGGTPTITIPHGLPAIPLVFGVWATQEDFSDSREFDTPNLAGVPYINSKANKDNVILTTDFSSTTSATDVYIRVYGYAPPDQDEDYQPTQQSSNKLLLDSRYAYSQLMFNGAIKLPSTSITKNYYIANTYLRTSDTASEIVLTHGLNTTPQVMMWLSNGEGANRTVERLRGANFSYPYGGIPWQSGSTMLDKTTANICTGWNDESYERTCYVRVYADA